jgi:hypothetical protein
VKQTVEADDTSGDTLRIHSSIFRFNGLKPAAER